MSDKIRTRNDDGGNSDTFELFMEWHRRSQINESSVKELFLLKKKPHASLRNEKLLVRIPKSTWSSKHSWIFFLFTSLTYSIRVHSIVIKIILEGIWGTCWWWVVASRSKTISIFVELLNHFDLRRWFFLHTNNFKLNKNNIVMIISVT